jgi:glycosyltransferase involved in cell wall biosynthesis
VRKLVIIPAYNESKNIEKVIGNINQHNSDVDILVVDDHSADNTGELAKRSGAYVIRHTINGGYGTALQTGYKFALYKNYDVVAQIDGDGQHDPSYLKELFGKIQNDGYDFVIGSRFLNSPREYSMPLLRKMGMRFFQSLIFLFTHKKISDPTSGYQALTKKVFHFFANGNVFPTDYPDADVIVLLHYAGFKVTEVPVVMYENDTGQSMHSGFKPIYYVIKMLLSLFIVRVNKKRKLI